VLEGESLCEPVSVRRGCRRRRGRCFALFDHTQLPILDADLETKEILAAVDLALRIALAHHDMLTHGADRKTRERHRLGKLTPQALQ
jgi:hypothetical protein